ncbi:MAG: AAA-like domain protein [Armatimonadetes bacterium OLB18]|nr:MAG: AAA-like domain protein [Armatimonadetes bacterium OLB18]
MRSRRISSPPIPPHWLGVVKNWLDVCRSLIEALIYLSAEVLRTHALVIGATGSGKTNFLHHLIVADLLRGHSIIVLDPRGDLAMAVIELAVRAGIDPSLVRFFDLREKQNPLGFNPLAGNGEPYYKALGLIDAIAAQVESWGVQLAETFRNALLLLAETNSSLNQLEGLFYNASVRRALIVRATTDSLKDFWRRYDALSPDKQAALASAVLNKVSALLSTEGLRRMFGHPDPVDIGEHLNQPGSITLISLAVDELHSAGWMTGGIMLSTICREVFSRATVAESQRNPIRLYVDEFENFSMRDFESILAEGRRFAFSVVLANQALAQLTPKLRSVILGNVGVKVVFRTGFQDAEVLNKDLAGVKGAFDLPNLPVVKRFYGSAGRHPFRSK